MKNSLVLRCQPVSYGYCARVPYRATTRRRHLHPGVKDVMAIKIISKILKLLSPSERRSLYLLFPAVIATGFLEVAGIASIVPFLSLVSNPQAIQENRWLALAFDRLGFGNANQFLIFLGSAALVILTISNVFTAFTTYYLTRFSHMRGYTLSKRLLIRYISQPYTFFLGPQHRALRDKPPHRSSAGRARNYRTRDEDDF